MPYSDETYNLRIELDTKNCSLSAGEIARMERALESLDRVTRAFPVSDLYVTVIYHKRSGDYHVKTSLILSGRTLFTGERHREMYPAYESCLDKLVRKVTAYKNSLDNAPEISKQRKGTHQNLVPSQVPDHDGLQRAVEQADYAGFRRATLMFEEPLRRRVGRRVQRYPELEELIGNRVEIADLVEDVFLTAFDRFESKPQQVPPGEWLEGLIDPVIHELLAHPDRELENINMARSANEAEGGGEGAAAQ